MLCGQEGGGGESYGWREALTVRGEGGNKRCSIDGGMGGEVRE